MTPSVFHPAWATAHAISRPFVRMNKTVRITPP